MQPLKLSEVHNKTGESARLLYAVTALQKIVTFVFNTLIVRMTDPSIFGVAAVQLELLLSTLLFLSREGVRLAVLKENIHSTAERQRVVNLSWMPAILLLCSAVSLVAYLHFTTNTDTGISINPLSLTLSTIDSDCQAPAGDNSSSSSLPLPPSAPHPTATVILLYCLGALLEVCGEPFLNLCQLRMEASPKATADAIAATVRSCTTYLCVAHWNMGVVGFGMAQLMHGFTHLLVASYSTLKRAIKDDSGKDLRLREFFPAWPVEVVLVAATTATGNREHEQGQRQAQTEPHGEEKEQFTSISSWQLVDFHTLSTAIAATMSSLLKHALTEADRIMLSITKGAAEQGVFAICSNYGSLAARLVFSPLEESSRTAFSRLAAQLSEVKVSATADIATSSSSSSSSDSGSGSSSTAAKESMKTDECENKGKESQLETEPSTPQQLLTAMTEQLTLTLQVTGIVGTLFCALGPAYVPLFVNALLAPQWRSTETVDTLCAYCWYILVLGINGVSEAFMYAVATPADFKFINVGLVVSTLAYGAATFLLNNSHVSVYAYQMMALCSFGTWKMEMQDESGIGDGGEGAAMVVWAGAVAMIVRIVFAVFFMRTYFKEHRQMQAQAQTRRKGEVHDGYGQGGIIGVRQISFLASALMLGIVARKDALQATSNPVSHLAWGVVYGLLFVVSVFYHSTEDEVAAAVDAICRDKTASTRLREEREEDQAKKKEQEQKQKQEQEQEQEKAKINGKCAGEGKRSGKNMSGQDSKTKDGRYYLLQRHTVS